MPEFKKAKEIALRKVKPLAPSFHRHIARNKLVGRVCQLGEHIVVYEVIATDPQGKVQVTEETIIQFIEE
jgi:hypothetical protein